LFLAYLQRGLFSVNLRMLKNFVFSRLRRTPLERIFICLSHAARSIFRNTGKIAAPGLFAGIRRDFPGRRRIPF